MVDHEARARELIRDWNQGEDDWNRGGVRIAHKLTPKLAAALTAAYNDALKAAARVADGYDEWAGDAIRGLKQ